MISGNVLEETRTELEKQEITRQLESTQFYKKSLNEVISVHDLATLTHEYIEYKPDWRQIFISSRYIFPRSLVNCWRSSDNNYWVFPIVVSNNTPIEFIHKWASLNIASNIGWLRFDVFSMEYDRVLGDYNIAHSQTIYTDFRA